MNKYSYNASDFKNIPPIKKSYVDASLPFRVCIE